MDLVVFWWAPTAFWIVDVAVGLDAVGEGSTTSWVTLKGQFTMAGLASSLVVWQTRNTSLISVRNCCNDYEQESKSGARRASKWIYIEGRLMSNYGRNLLVFPARSGLICPSHIPSMVITAPAE